MNSQHKANIFNDYSAYQCKTHDNGSVLPDIISGTDISESLIIVNTDQIIEIIQMYSTKKAHGFDEISVAMLQLCAREVTLSISLIFQKCLSTGTVPVPWKCANVQPIHKETSVR